MTCDVHAPSVKSNARAITEQQQAYMLRGSYTRTSLRGLLEWGQGVSRSWAVSLAMCLRATYAGSYSTCGSDPAGIRLFETSPSLGKLAAGTSGML